MKWYSPELSNAYEVMAKASRTAEEPKQHADLVEAMYAIERADNIIAALAKAGAVAADVQVAA